MKNLTPAHMRCDVVATCPSLRQLEDGRLLIVGRDAMAVTPDDDHVISRAAWTLYDEKKIGDGEAAIVISPDLLDDYVAGKVKPLVELLERAKRELEDATACVLDEQGDLIEMVVGDIERAISSLHKQESKE